jgi:hypothetical protein
LLNVIDKLLKKESGSSAILLNPRRGNSLSEFLEKLDQRKAKLGVKYELVERYDDEITKIHEKLLQNQQYDPDIHYPLLLTITRC